MHQTTLVGQALHKSTVEVHSALAEFRARTSQVTRWCYWQGNGLEIHRSQVRVLAGHHCLGHTSYTCVPLSPNSMILYRPRAVISLALAGKVTVGLVESNGSLPPGARCKSKTGRHNQDRSCRATNHRRTLARPVLDLQRGPDL